MDEFDELLVNEERPAAEVSPLNNWGFALFGGGGGGVGETTGAGAGLALLESFFDELESFLFSYKNKYVSKKAETLISLVNIKVTRLFLMLFMIISQDVRAR